MCCMQSQSLFLDQLSAKLAAVIVIINLQMIGPKSLKLGIPALQYINRKPTKIMLEYLVAGYDFASNLNM